MLIRMKIQENIPLAQYTTFKIGGPARFFCRVSSEDELLEAAKFAKKEKRRFLVLGGGSNILISDAGFSGVVAKMEIKGMEMKERKAQGESEVVLSVGAGEQWDDVVEYAVSRGLYGIENLSAIPGTAGAAPVQNIGAYGAELSQVVDKVRVLDIWRLAFAELSGADCRFSYRNSVFKEKKGRYAVTGLDLRLSRTGRTNVEYKDLKEYFRNKVGEGVAESGEGARPRTAGGAGFGVPDAAPSLGQVREAVIEIRWRKLPDWRLWGTAGSYFKNPVISAARFEWLRGKYPEVPGHPEPDGRIKVSAAWLIDNICRVKGVWDDRVGMYKNHALVMVAKPGATAAEVIGFSEKILNRVEKETTIKLQAEVEWVN